MSSDSSESEIDVIRKPIIDYSDEDGLALYAYEPKPSQLIWKMFYRKHPIENHLRRLGMSWVVAGPFMILSKAWIKSLMLFTAKF